jgi:ribosomal protein S7
VGRDRVLLVTVPPPGSAGDALWRRFCKAVGVDATRYPPVDQASNASLSAPEAELFRRVNEGIADMSPRDYTVLVRQHLMQQTGAARDERPTLPPEFFDRILQRAQDQVEALEQDEVPVLGNLRDLLPDTFDYTSGATTTVAEVTDEQLMPIAVRSLQALLRSAADQRAMMQALSQELVEARNAPLRPVAARRLRDVERRIRARRGPRGSRTG